jgi:curved DNA-binding protein CbpA
MRSAYLVLGVPGNASQEEIETAFRRSEALFTRERLAEEEGALARFGELKSAYQVLRDPESRAAHDRKLQDAARAPRARPRTVVVEPEESPYRKLMIAGFVLVALVFGTGAAVNYRNAQVRKEQAAIELATQKAAAEEAERKRLEEERQAAERVRQASQQRIDERRLAMEAQYSAARASANLQAAEAYAASARRAETAEQQRREYARREEERRAVYEARQRVEADKRRVRELCYQQYRRSDC